jgi:hypothetical protein
MSSSKGLVLIISTVLLYLLFAANLYLGYITHPDTRYVKYIIFGVIYLVLGLIMTGKVKFSGIIVFIAIFIILFIYPAITDLKDLHPSSWGFMSAINAIILIACFITTMLKIRD